MSGFEVMKSVLDAIASDPVPLFPAMKALATATRKQVPSVEDLKSSLNSENGPTGLATELHMKLSDWENLDSAPWTRGTARQTEARRSLIYDLLDLPDSLRKLLNGVYPLDSTDGPVVITREFSRWYSDRKLSPRFYWNHYRDYLSQHEKWPGTSISELDRTTNSVIERLADPYRAEAYASRGLVVGYVQSGKTANFTGVLAKAADAGYRLFIILAGTLDILRNQTQRRIDKDLIGREILALDSEGNEYATDRRWGEFISHGGLPSTRGAFDWHRLTRLASDYVALKQGREVLVVTKRAGGHLNGPENLANHPARIVVAKKNPVILRRLVDDLQRLDKKFRQATPVIIIDDESDQASINVRKPKRDANGTVVWVKPEDRERTATNEQIVELLKLLPRAQYIGYTATPFANVLVDAEDNTDLFPRDFLISLPKPPGYMGVAEFLDQDSEETSEDPATSNDRAFIRSVRDEDERPENLPRAIDCFVLSGAIKLFRQSRGCPVRTDHHTMLVHRSPRQMAHEDDKDFVEALFENARFHHAGSTGRLEAVLASEFRPVWQARAHDLPFPRNLSALRPYIEECLNRIEKSPFPVRIVNGDTRRKDQTPNFEEEQVWSILVGGTKLSRGYTVEGLTTSYYRRTANTTDTLMQMGRWFGFRRNYQDLVRLFVGRSEHVGTGNHPPVDLLACFKGACRDEENFRGKLKLYSQVGGITPEQVPPLVPFHLLKPTSRNKMHYAHLVSENFGGRWREPVSFPDHSEKERIKTNSRLFSELLAKSDLQRSTLAAVGSKAGSFDAFTTVVSKKSAMKLFEEFQWTEVDSNLLGREVQFLSGAMGDPCIDDFLVIAPQLRMGTASPTWPVGNTKFTVKERARADYGQYGVLTEPGHKAAAAYVAGLADGSAPAAMAALRRERRGVVLFYPVRSAKETETTMGFAILFPKNNIQQSLAFYAVEKPGHQRK